jgi:hypothetical protein
MGKLKIILVLAVLAAVVAAGWQIISCKVANEELQSDLKDLSAQVSARIGLDAQRSDAEFREAVVRRAREHDIELEPEQVIVKRTGTGVGTGGAPTVYLAVDYNARVNLLVYSFTLHFNPSSTK